MQWYKTLSVDELPINTMQNFKVANRKILLINAEKKLYAVNHSCTHDDIDLSLGCLKGQTIKCSLHGAIFNLADGKVLVDPAEDDLQTWQTRITNNIIEVLL